ncbi:MAG: hypothetical protein M1823_004858 [Watsoniomyces obsoletus]|nr:MAG: hypothetical protein M1823_004858 [Watsoniomyces obsoletus]
MNAHEAPQPKMEDAYNQPDNPVTHKPSETKAGQQQSALNDPGVFSRRAGDQGDIEPTPSAIGAGSTRAPIDEDAAPADELDGEQMRMPGEGEVMRAQANKTGTGEEKSLTSDLDRKKEEQQGRREQIQQQRQAAVEQGGALGQQGGPALVEGR